MLRPGADLWLNVTTRKQHQTEGKAKMTTATISIEYLLDGFNFSVEYSDESADSGSGEWCWEVAPQFPVNDEFTEAHHAEAIGSMTNLLWMDGFAPVKPLTEDDLSIDGVTIEVVAI
jgi:hypothetical protein